MAPTTNKFTTSIIDNINYTTITFYYSDTTNFIFSDRELNKINKEKNYSIF